MFHFLVVSYFKPYENGTPSVLYKIKKKNEDRAKRDPRLPNLSKLQLT